MVGSSVPASLWTPPPTIQFEMRLLCCCAPDTSDVRFQLLFNTLMALYQAQNPPPISADLLSSSVLVKACLNQESKQSEVLVGVLLPSIGCLLPPQDHPLILSPIVRNVTTLYVSFTQGSVTV